MPKKTIKKISNQIKDFLHKLSYCFVANYKNIVIENYKLKLCKKGMSRKSINYLELYEIVRQLSCKLQ
ncbi:transposase, OrfB family (plasmid) [Borreliella finlandensis]|uniref:Transposase, OrfB family n=1 Tax=Borreliella finlandensis TaxID=498741 RepID=A0A806CKV2_9SPIR|nr:transposase [Borreliella finlandensis]ACN93372.1 transposase, OrfB family [Borreliella finlandensis]